MFKKQELASWSQDAANSSNGVCHSGNRAQREGAHNRIHRTIAQRDAFSAPEYSLQAPKTEVVTLPPLESLVQESMKYRPDAQAMDWKVRAFSNAADLAHSERLPKINGFGAGGEGRFNGTTVKPEQQHGVGALGLLIPVFTGGRLEAAQQEAKAELDGAFATREQLKQQIRQEVTDVYYQLLEFVERVRAADQQRMSANEALRLAQARYNMQLASFLDVLTAQVTKTAAETNYARTQFDYDRARAELEFATGQPAQHP